MLREVKDPNYRVVFGRWTDDGPLLPAKLPPSRQIIAPDMIDSRNWYDVALGDVIP